MKKSAKKYWIVLRRAIKVKVKILEINIEKEKN